jgi:hypothetical protein
VLFVRDVLWCGKSVTIFICQPSSSIAQDSLKLLKRFIGNALDVSLGVWRIATKGIILLKSVKLQMPDVLDVVNARLSQQILLFHWSILPRNSCQEPGSRAPTSNKNELPRPSLSKK